MVLHMNVTQWHGYLNLKQFEQPLHFQYISAFLEQHKSLLDFKHLFLCFSQAAVVGRIYLHVPLGRGVQTGAKRGWQ
eukprot:942308-Pelagomonas_calceolata.AAC.1